MNITQTITLTLAAASALCAVPASAQLAVSFAAVSPVHSGAADQNATFTATFVNHYSYPLYLTTDEFTGPDAPLTVDDSAFLNTFPLAASPHPIAAGDTVTTDLFTVTVPAGTPTGGFDGTFYLFGGRDLTDTTDALSATKFHVDVQAVPEASSVVSLGLLLALGMGGVFAAGRRKKAV